MKYETQAYANARRFIENNVDLIDIDNWAEFFYLMWKMYGSTSLEVINIFKDVGIDWDEATRQEELFDGVHETMKNQVSNDIHIRDLYRTTSPMFSPRSWLGYTEDEFYDILMSNADRLSTPEYFLNGSKLVWR